MSLTREECSHPCKRSIFRVSTCLIHKWMELPASCAKSVGTVPNVLSWCTNKFHNLTYLLLHVAKSAWERKFYLYHNFQMKISDSSFIPIKPFVIGTHCLLANIEMFNVQNVSICLELPFILSIYIYKHCTF